MREISLPFFLIHHIFSNERLDGIFDPANVIIVMTLLELEFVTYKSYNVVMNADLRFVKKYAFIALSNVLLW